VGESVRSGTRIARLDSLGRFKLDLRLDEFHLARVREGLAATLTHEGRSHALHVARIDPQVKDGRFSVELAFDADPPPLQVGQGLDVRLTLGEARQALLLPDAGFYADTGGAWAFVLDADGRHARRRPLQLGRRADGVIEVLGGLQAGAATLLFLLPWPRPPRLFAPPFRCPCCWLPAGFGAAPAATGCGPVRPPPEFWLLFVVVVVVVMADDSLWFDATNGVETGVGAEWVFAMSC